MGLFDFLQSIPPVGTSAHKAYLHSTGLTPEQGAANYAAQQSVPPQGTSAYKAYQYNQRTGTDSTDIIGAIAGDQTSPNNPSPAPYGSTSSDYSVSKAAAFDYLNAELAKYYGMSKTTAYQEALSNTSYQRAVRDMRDAGLNPAVLFGSGHGQSANSSIYAAEERSGGGGYSRRSGSGSSNNGKLFSGSAYSAIQAIGGLVGIAVTGRPDGFWVGSQTAKGAMGLLDSISKK